MSAELEEAVARAIYELDPFYEGGEYVDGFLASPGGNLSWEQACARDAEMENVSFMLSITKPARDAARAALAVVREKMGEPVAQAIVDDLFQDLRGRSFLKWLFSEFPTLIGNLEGEALTSLDDDVQQEIQQEWKAIIKARLAASPLGESKP